MKTLFLFLFICIISFVHAQNISGLYAGTLTNDSTGKEQQYELALSEYRGIITGYAYTTFIVNDTFYYSVNRIKAVRNANVLEVEDIKMLAHNFPRAPDKGVRQIMYIPLSNRDTITQLAGTWKTTQTKKFYSVGGGLILDREKDSSQSALVQHLYDTKEWQQPPAAALPLATAQNKKESTFNKPAPSPKMAVALKPSSLPYTQRAEQLVKQIVTAADSLVLSFYDNGVVDGDTISVYLNNENIISRTRLTAAAAQQTIRLDGAADNYKLILVAENLGTIPPNTGLLVIQDGANRYQVHFTADLQTNAAIEFKRKQRSEKTN